MPCVTCDALLQLAAVVSEQHAVAAQLRQEAKDHRLAARLQRQLSSIKVGQSAPS